MPFSPRDRGQFIADTLAQCWRQAPPPLDLTPPDLATFAQPLLAAGVGALAWRRIQGTDLAMTPEGLALADAYRLYTLKAEVYRHDLAGLLSRLRPHGIEPLLVKGLSVARLYPQMGLRPVGDIDVVVSPQDYATTLTIVRGRTDNATDIDLHSGAAKLLDRPWHDVYDRSQTISFGGSSVRVPAPEDQLRLLCLHFMRHGGWRPLWLCDIAVAIEHRPAIFDWDLCLGGPQPYGDWVGAVCALAHRLLGAEVANTPIANYINTLPAWVIPNTLTRWGLGRHPYRAPWRAYLRHPLGLRQALSGPWPEPIEAIAWWHAPLNTRLPWLLQLALYGKRVAWYVSSRISARTSAPPTPSFEPAKEDLCTLACV